MFRQSHIYVIKEFSNLDFPCKFHLITDVQVNAKVEEVSYPGIIPIYTHTQQYILINSYKSFESIYQVKQSHRVIIGPLETSVNSYEALNHA